MKKKFKSQEGITLIALVITIIVMIILVAVTINMAVNGGLFNYAGKAVEDTQNAIDIEKEIASGKIEVDGVLYNSIGELTDELNKPKVVEPTNIEDWIYTVEEDGTITINKYKGTDTEVVIPNYINGIPVKSINAGGPSSLWHSSICSDNVAGLYAVTQETITKVVISEGITDLGYNAFIGSVKLKEVVLPEGITALEGTFYGCKSLTTAPTIQNSVTDMGGTFSGCTSLTTAPTIPNSVTDMGGTFSGCTSLTTAPIIPSSVTDMYATFSGCTSLTTAPIIPSSVTDMYATFSGCTSLTGDLVINANPSNYESCLKNCATNTGCNLKLSGTSEILDSILETAGSNANISKK